MSSGKDVIIEVKNFTAKYGDVVIIDDISFEVYGGEIFVILGGSGCGKSTFETHDRLYKPARGNIIIKGETSR
jgi:phospholipid/cholesterol/gamma-HCH transport system ATP-binding protein